MATVTETTCQNCGSKNSHREGDTEYCSGCGVAQGPSFTAQRKPSLTDAKPRRDGNDVRCGTCSQDFWLHPLAAVCNCPHCGQDLHVMSPMRK